MNRPVILTSVLAAASIAQAQSLTGNAEAFGVCGPDLVTAPSLPSDFTLRSHGECDAPRFGGLGSINDAAMNVQAAAGLLLGHAVARSDFFGTFDAQGAAVAGAELTLTASDLVFVDINDPNSTRAIQSTMNLIVAGHAATAGHSNCSPSLPFAQAFFNLTAANQGLTGTMTITGGGAVDQVGAFAGYANDGSPTAFTTAEGSVSLGTNNPFFLRIHSQATVQYCDRPPAELGTSDALVSVRFPTGTPVFNLPPGVTVNSAQLHIVDNIWSGFCRPDVNGDGRIDVGDFLSFLSLYAAADLRADLNGSGTIDVTDFLTFLSAFAAGC